MNKVAVIFVVFLSISSAVAEVSASKDPIPSDMSTPVEIEGAFGIKFGDQIEPYLEGHYAPMTKLVKNYRQIAPNNELTYMLINPPRDIKDSIGASQTEYMAIVNEKYQIVEILLRAVLNSNCDSAEMAAVVEVFRSRYKVIKPQKHNSLPSEKYSDGNNSIELECQSGLLTLAYTSNLFDDYIAYLEDVASTRIEEQREALKGGL